VEDLERLGQRASASCCAFAFMSSSAAECDLARILAEPSAGYVARVSSG
jgi:hypothetical protein